MNRIGCLAVCLIVAASGFATLTSAQEAPKPGPEHERLGYWVGTWVGEAKVMENPVMPSGPMRTRDRCEWFQGGFAVVCHIEGEGPMGPMKGIGIMGYSAEQSAYTYYGLDNTGMAMTTVPLGRVDGKTWVFEDESRMGEMTIKSRYKMVELSQDEYSFEWAMQGPDGQWMTIVQGVGKRQG